MAFDSAASLLFNIGANSDDAEENIQRFRQLLGTNLDDIAGQFSQWSEDVLGDLSTVEGAMIGLTAAAGALGVVLAGFAVESAHKFEEYAIEIGNASQKTGIATETLSAMHLAAHEVGVGFEQVVTGIVRFERSVFAAQDPTSKQAQLLARMGFTTAQVQGAMQNIDPFLEEFGKKFAHLHEGPEKTGVAMEFMGRSGTEMNKFFMQWAARAEELRKAAHDLGIELSTNDVYAAREYMTATKGLEMEWTAFSLTIGQAVLPKLRELVIDLAGVTAVAKHLGEEHTLRNWVGTTMIDAITGLKAKQKSLWDSWVEGANEAAVAMAKVATSAEAAATVHALDLVAPHTEKVKAATQEFSALTSMLDGLKIKLGEMENPEAKLAAELERMRDSAAKSTAELIKLHDEGKLATGVWEAQLPVVLAVRKAIGEYGEAAGKALGNKDLEEIQKTLDGLAAAKAAVDAKIVAAGRELQEKLEAQSTQTYEHQIALFQAEVERMREKYQAEGALNAENTKTLEAIATAGEKRISGERQQSYERELEAFQQHIAKMLEANMTAEEKLAATYRLEVAKLGAEAAKASAGATPAQASKIGEQYVGAQLELLDQYQAKLQGLVNSHGFQSVFGDKFAALIKNNEELSKQWAESTHQDSLIMQASWEALGELGEQSLDKLEEGMTSAAAHALVYGGSMEKAMRQAAASTLESISSQAMVLAINAMAWGFYDLATPGLEQFAPDDFQAAALWGAIGVGSGLLGRVVAGRQGAAGSGGGASGGASGGRGGGVVAASGGGGGVGGDGGGSGIGGAGGSGAVNVYVMGHVIGPSGIEEFAGMLNDAVQNRDVRLVATQVRQGPLATH
jgi:hypothetical protein